MDYQNNGRVKIVNNERIEIYPMSKQTKKRSDFNEEAIKGIHANNPVSSIFFSDINIDALQEAIRYQVYLRSCKKHTIGKQSDTELKVIMRATYLENARHRDYDVLPEIKRLNQLVLDFAVPRIIQEIKMYTTYTNDIERLPVPMDRGEFQSSKGTKVLEQKRF
jgi:hypothetical protein